MSAGRAALWVRFRRAIVTLVLGASAAIAALLSGNGMGLLDGLVYDLSLAVTDRRAGGLSTCVNTTYIAAPRKATIRWRSSRSIATASPRMNWQHCRGFL